MPSKKKISIQDPYWHLTVISSSWLLYYYILEGILGVFFFPFSSYVKFISGLSWLNFTAGKLLREYRTRSKTQLMKEL